MNNVGIDHEPDAKWDALKRKLLENHPAFTFRETKEGGVLNGTWFLIHSEGDHVGFVWLSPDEQVDTAIEVSVAVLPGVTGVATTALRLLEKRVLQHYPKAQSLVARVRPENVESRDAITHVLTKKLGYNMTSPPDWTPTLAFKYGITPAFKKVL